MNHNQVRWIPHNPLTTWLTLPGALSGRVFALSQEDARAIVMSEYMASSVWMTEPYDIASLPFITISITHGACLYFGAQRRQVMWIRYSFLLCSHDISHCDDTDCIIPPSALPRHDNQVVCILCSHHADRSNPKIVIWCFSDLDRTAGRWDVNNNRYSIGRRRGLKNNFDRWTVDEFATIVAEL